MLHTANAQHDPSTGTQVKHQTLHQGELLADLRKKDPRLDQELNDLHYIQSKIATATGRRELGIEEPPNCAQPCPKTQMPLKIPRANEQHCRETRRVMEMEDHAILVCLTFVSPLLLCHEKKE